MWRHWRVRKSIENGVDIFVHFSTTPMSILNLTMSPESQENDVSNDILAERKYSQLFTHESNIFLLKQLYQFTNAVQQWCHSLFIDCSQTDGRKSKHHMIFTSSLRSLGGYKNEDVFWRVCSSCDSKREEGGEQEATPQEVWPPTKFFFCIIGHLSKDKNKIVPIGDWGHLLTLTLNLDDLESHIVMNVSSTSNIIPSFIEIGQSRFFGKLWSHVTRSLGGNWKIRPKIFWCSIRNRWNFFDWLKNGRGDRFWKSSFLKL